MRIINKDKNTILAEEAVIADTVLKRIKGLLGKKGLKSGEAIILEPCNSIHTFFMRFTIDIVFVDKQNKVIKAISGIKPWRITGVYFPSRLCIELPPGTIKSTLTSYGDTLLFIKR